MKLLKGLVLILLPVMGFSQVKSYEIKGDIKDLPDNTKLFLIRTSVTGGPDTVQTAMSRSGKFKFNGSLKDEGELHFIKLDTTKVKLAKKGYSWTRLVLDNSKVALAGELSEWPALHLNNSVPTGLFDEYLMKSSVLQEEVKKMSDQKDSVGANKAIKALNDFTTEFIRQHSASVVAPLVMSMNGALTDSEKIIMYDNFPPNIKNSFYGKEWKRDYELANSRSGIKEGAIIPDFEFKTTKGQSTTILKAIKGSKYTLIDFWASWCRPCRAEMPNLRNAYELFNKKGFNIIGIAVKDELPRWHKALKEENPDWMQGRDDDMEVWNLFGFSSIPAYAIVDENGKLIAYQCALSQVSPFGGPIRGEDLIKKLNELVLSN